MQGLSEKILNILVKTKRISLKQKQQVMSFQKQKDASIRDILINEGIISSKELLTVLSEEFSNPQSESLKITISKE